MTAVLDACGRIRGSVSMSALAARSVKLRRVGREWVGCCPFHPDRSPSFTIYADDRRFQCFGCGAQGDALDFVRRIEGIDLVEAIRRIDEGALPVAERQPARDDDRPAARLEEARAIWRASVPAEETEAQAYLAHRGLSGPIPPVLRFARLRYGSGSLLHPAIVALVVDVNGKPQGIQRTYLAAGGRGKLAVEKPKLSLGRVKRGAIRLGVARDEVIVAEGMEDAFTLQCSLRVPAWAAAGAGMMPAMILPRLIRSIIIGADADAAGERSAQEARGNFTADGRAVRIIRPASPHKDFNAELCAELAVAA